MTAEEERLRARVAELEARVEALGGDTPENRAILAVRLEARIEELTNKVLDGLPAAHRDPTEGKAQYQVWAEPLPGNPEKGQWANMDPATALEAEERAERLNRMRMKAPSERKWHYEVRRLVPPPSWYEQLMDDD